MRLIHEIGDLRAEPVVSPRGAIVSAHALLDDRPLTLAGDEETVVVDAEAILDRGRINLRRHAAVVGEPRAVDAGAIAVVEELVRCSTRHFPLTSGNENAQFIAALGETLFEGAADGGGHPARVPVESEYAAEGLEPVRVR